MLFGFRLPEHLPKLDRQIWILAAGRLLSQIGSGFTLFYAPIFFVNSVGLSATAVGLGLGSASISGMIGRLLGGSLTDSPRWGRRYTLLLANLILALGALTFAGTTQFPMFVLGNLLTGFGIGLYWPATETIVADLTTLEQRHEAYAVTRLADNLGLGLGIILGGGLIRLTGSYRTLFLLDALSFLVFCGLIWGAIAESRTPTHTQEDWGRGWLRALQDQRLLIYGAVNILLTTYIAQIQTTLPVYLSNFVPLSSSEKGFSEVAISGLFAWHVLVSIVCQLPVARALNFLSRPRVLICSALCWALSFGLIAWIGLAPGQHLVWAVVALGVSAIAIIIYTPAASSFVVELAPPELRGVYLSFNSQCWAIGYLVAPPLGGFALDLGRPAIYNFWLLLASSVIAAVLILQYLDRLPISQH